MIAFYTQRPPGRSVFLSLVFILSSFFWVSQVQAYDCSGLPEYTYGQAEVNSIYRNIDSAWRCTAGWCAWARPGQDPWADGAWEGLGACGDVTPQNTPPTVSITSSSGTVYVDEPTTFSAQANDVDGNITGYSLTVYEVTMDGYQNPQVLDGGSAMGSALTVNMQGVWSSSYTRTYVLVASVADAHGEEARAERRFTVGQETSSSFEVSHPEQIQLNTEARVNVNVLHPGFSARPEIEILTPSGVSVGTLSSSSSASSSTSSGSYSSWELVKTFNASEAGEYQVNVTWETDPAFNQSTSITVVGADEASVDAYPDTLYQYYRSGFSLSADHPTSSAIPAVTITNTTTGQEVLYLDGVDSRTLPGASSSSSSGNPSTGFNLTLIGSEMVFATSGEHRLRVDYPDGQSAEDFFTVLSGFDYPGTIDLSVSSPSSGSSYAIDVSTDHFDVSSIAIYVDGSDVNAIGQGGINTRYSFSASHQWDAAPGSHEILAVVTNVRGDTFEETLTFVVDGEVEEGDCVQVGINLADVHAYPNFPNLDWKGDPFNANTGDLMSYQNEVFRAKWWTQTVPGSDQSWEYVCAL